MSLSTIVVPVDRYPARWERLVAPGVDLACWAYSSSRPIFRVLVRSRPAVDQLRRRAAGAECTDMVPRRPRKAAVITCRACNIADQVHGGASNALCRKVDAPWIHPFRVLVPIPK